MKKTLSILIGICLAFPIFTYGQQPIKTNQFKIGMFGFEYYSVSGLPPTSLKVGGYNSSQSNVLSEDGFNLVTRYNPDYLTSIAAMQNIINLA